MLANSPETTKPTGNGRFFVCLTSLVGGVTVVITPSNSSRWIAIGITLILHLVVLWTAMRNSRSIPPSEFLAGRLHYIELPPLEEPHVLRVVQPPVINPDAFKLNSPQDVLPPLPELTLQLEPLTPQEINELLGGNNVSSQTDSAEIARNVFHPGLRKQLTDASNKPVLARIEDRGLETYMDPSGTTVVMLEGGGCLRSPPTKIGEPRNWYVSVTPCPGKSESEKIMDRVNDAVNGKLKLE